ncbi:MAG: cadherin domain-containing protein, partial [Sedimenticola sp.]
MANDGEKNGTPSGRDKGSKELFDQDIAEDQEQGDKSEEFTEAGATPEYAQEDITMSAIQRADIDPETVSESHNEGAGIDLREESERADKEGATTLDELDESEQDSERSNSPSDTYSEVDISYTAAQQASAEEQDEATQSEQPNAHEARVNRHQASDEEDSGGHGSKGKKGKDQERKEADDTTSEENLAAGFEVTDDDTNIAPEDIQLSASSISENVEAGTLVANLGATDRSSDETLSFELLDDPSGLFEVVGDTLVVKEGARIDFEDASFHDLVIQVTDSAGNSYSESFTIDINDVNEAPLFGDDLVASVDESSGILSGRLEATDTDSNTELSYSIDGDTPAGFELNADGSYSFDPSDNAYSALGVGDSTVVTIPILVTDERGETASSQIQVTVSGTNDAPVAAADVIASV